MQRADSKSQHPKSEETKESKSQHDVISLDESQLFKRPQLRHVTVCAANVWWHSFTTIISESARMKAPAGLTSAATVISFNKKLGEWHILPKNSLSESWQIDLKSICTGEAKVRAYPRVSPTVVFELQQEMLLYNRYLDKEGVHSEDLDEKISESEQEQKEKSELEEKEKSEPDDDAPPMRRILFMGRPDDDPFIANCNKTTRNLLQEAADRTAKLYHQKDKTIISRQSRLSFGSNQTMFICNSGLHQRMLNFFIPDVNERLDAKGNQFLPAKNVNEIRLARLDDIKSEKNRPLLKELADNKNFILKVILQWPKEQQKRGLQQIYDVNTPFGLIFRTPRSDKRKEPDFLKEAAEKLNTLLKELPSHKENEKSEKKSEKQTEETKKTEDSSSLIRRPR